MSGGNKNGKAPSVALDWKVGGTKKGALPIRVEKRGHKTVTIVYNVVQRPDMLLYDLKRSIGTGMYRLETLLPRLFSRGITE